MTRGVHPGNGPAPHYIAWLWRAIEVSAGHDSPDIGIQREHQCTGAECALNWVGDRRTAHLEIILGRNTIW